jgi:uncharacterized protein
MTPNDIITHLKLEPLVPEGGYYRETYRAVESIPAYGLPGRYMGPRAFSTAIYFLLTSDTVSAMHRLLSDEVFHFLAGDPVELLRLYPDGTSEVATLGQDIAHGHHLQVVVPRDVWQGAALAGKGSWVLMGVTVAPGFEYADYEHGDREKLISGWPDRAALIRRLTPA